MRGEQGRGRNTAWPGRGPGPPTSTASPGFPPHLPTAPPWSPGAFGAPPDAGQAQRFPPGPQFSPRCAPCAPSAPGAPPFPSTLHAGSCSRVVSQAGRREGIVVFNARMWWGAVDTVSFQGEGGDGGLPRGSEARAAPAVSRGPSRWPCAPASEAASAAAELRLRLSGSPVGL